MEQAATTELAPSLQGNRHTTIWLECMAAKGAFSTYYLMTEKSPCNGPFMEFTQSHSVSLPRHHSKLSIYAALIEEYHIELEIYKHLVGINKDTGRAPCK